MSPPSKHALLLFFLASCASVNNASQAITVVDASKESIATRIAVQVCAGLYNRDSGKAYILLGKSNDKEWLEDLEGLSNPELTNVSSFLSSCLQSSSPVAKGYLRYNYTAQQRIVPNIITMAAVLDAVPLEDQAIAAFKGTPIVFDAVSVFAGFSALDATQYVYERHGNQTTTMTKMNPGLDVHGQPWSPNPPLTRSPDVSLVDFIVKERLFNFFLADGCLPLTKEHALMERMVDPKNSPMWPQPIRVYGYDDTFPIAGDLFEAETTCVSRHNLGQVASSGVNNLAFFGRKGPITQKVPQVPVAAMSVYNKSKTYISFIIGDGDNLEFLKGSRRDWIKQRVGYCTADSPNKQVKGKRGCFPLVWTLSPATLRVAGEWLHWYYNQSRITQQDHFVLPPSGDLYSYPSMMDDATQELFVNHTEVDCELMDTQSSVAWEFMGTWGSAIKNYFPRYAKQSIVQGLFAVNVPYMIPVLEFIGKEYKIFDGKVVLFAPNEWRGGGCKSKQCYNATQLADEINSYPEGTVSHFYITSDGGANLDELYKVVDLLDDKVEIVNHKDVVNLALQRG